MKTTSQNNERHSQYIENNRNCQTFVFNADEVSLEALLDPHFRPIPTTETPQQQIYYGNDRLPQRSLSTSIQPARYERAQFDPLTDLSSTQPFSTIPTRRRQQILNNSSIIHL
jgi:hypothetical protein